MKYTPAKYHDRQQLSYRISQSMKKKSQQFNPRLYVTSSISEQDVILIKQAFDYHDTNGTGKLTPNDLKVIIKKYQKVALLKQHFNATKQTAYNIIAQYDQQCIGGLNFAAFMRIISSDPRQLQPRSQLQKVFKKYDKQNKGYFTKQNLQEVIRSQGNKFIKDKGQNMTQMEIDKLWYKLDRDNRGKIDFDRFSQVMHHPNSIY